MFASTSKVLIVSWICFTIWLFWAIRRRKDTRPTFQKAPGYKHPIIHEMILVSQVEKLGFQLKFPENQLPSDRPPLSKDFVLVGIFRDQKEEEIVIDLSQRHLYRAKIYDLHMGRYWQCKLYKVTNDNFRYCKVQIPEKDTDS